VSIYQDIASYHLSCAQDRRGIRYGGRLLSVYPTLAVMQGSQGQRRKGSRVRGVRIVRRSFYSVFPKWPPAKRNNNWRFSAHTARAAHSRDRFVTPAQPPPVTGPPTASPLKTEPTEKGMSIYQDMAFDNSRYIREKEL